MDPRPFTFAELDYLGSQRLGRLATVSGDGAPQNNPVGFVVNEALGTIDISGSNLTASKKFRNLRSNPNVSFVVDDIASTDPWEVRGIEVRGIAEALDGHGAPGATVRRPVIRVWPRRIISWNVDDEVPGMLGRDVSDPRTAA
jgi:pyridoxamine 5'-phosphate oxidase family protein